MLQSEPALHSNQRCGGSSVRPSIFRTKGPGAAAPWKPSVPARCSGTAGRGRGAKLEEKDRHSDRPGQTRSVCGTYMADSFTVSRGREERQI